MYRESGCCSGTIQSTIERMSSGGKNGSNVFDAMSTLLVVVVVEVEGEFVFKTWIQCYGGVMAG